MKQKLLALLLALAVLLPAGCGELDAENVMNLADAVLSGKDAGVIGGEDGPTEVLLPEEDGSGGEDLYQDASGEDAEALAEDGTYNSAEDVAAYLTVYGHLPDNYLTKSEARDLGWTGGSVEQYAPGCAIGGDRFGNREGILPEGSYHECDIGTDGASSRGAKRLVYSDEAIYYTEDHYESFTRLDFYEEDGVLTVGCEGDGHHEDHHG